MVAGKVKMAMGLQKSPSNNNKPNKSEKTPPPPSQSPSSGGKQQKSTVFNRSFGVYFPRASAQVQPQPRTPDVSNLLKLVEDLRERESRLKTELLEHKLLRQSAAIVPVLESQIVSKDAEIQRLSKKILELEVENGKLVHERELIKERFEVDTKEREAKIAKLEAEIEELRHLSSSQRFQKNLNFRKAGKRSSDGLKVGESGSMRREEILIEVERPSHSRCNSSDSIPETSDSGFSAVVVKSKAPRVPKPPPKRCSPDSSPSSSSPDGRKSTGCVSAPPPPPAVKSGHPPPPPPPPPPPQKKSSAPAPPPPPPPPKGMKAATAKVKRVPEVVEFYHSLMRRDSRRDSGAGTVEFTAASARDLVGEIENRSAYLLAIKTDVETQGDFIRFLIKEIETAAFTDIEDVVSFVKWLDDELSYLVDERAVLKHFDWPEQKADALREAAFEYSDLKKLESEASSLRDDARQACGSVLKKMQTLLEKLEHGVYNLSRLRESATNRFKSFHIPVDWMLDAGFVSQIKLASVKLAMKYMKRVSAELEAVNDAHDEEELIVQGVRFAFRVHQFAGGFDVETMGAFEELRDKARSCHNHCQNQQYHQPQRPMCRSMPG
ncbi:hypothetical protein Cgig2_008761 [Carnegiea gigantea]|uniref:Protein CHUP1, chloroplastic n=1 Tax=Carnegiea gigantea TaxID=171969 RepID=A0A9Q1K611_9CARY|nr:hypothetical protein Cgig2_008761 [Carnegiea gigantea]